MTMTAKLILMCALITRIFVLCASTDYTYDDYEEIPNSSPSIKMILTSPQNLFENEIEQRKTENDIEGTKDQLDVMSNTFRKTINKIKFKHKKIEIVFLVDSSSSVGKENFANEISFVKRFLSDFNVSFNYTRVALVTFSSRFKIVSVNL